MNNNDVHNLCTSTIFLELKIFWSQAIILPSYLFWSKSTNQQPKGFWLTCLLYVYRCESYTLCKYNKQGSEQGGLSVKLLEPKF